MLELPAGNSSGGASHVQWYYRMGLGRRLALGSAALTALIVAALLSLADYRTERNRSTDASNAIIAAQLAGSAAEFIINRDHLALQALLGELTRHPAVVFATVKDQEQRTLAESGTAGIEGKSLATYSQPCKLGDDAVGSVDIQVRQPDARQFNLTHITLLSGVVFILCASLLLLHLHGLDAALSLANRRLRTVVPAPATPQPGSPLALLGALSSNAADRYGPLTAGQPAVALALRLPELAEDFPGQRPNPVRLAEVVQSVTQIADQQLARLSGRHDGWLLEFRSGDGRAARAMRCAARLREALESGSWNHDWHMTLDLEALRDDGASPALRELQWQRNCDRLYQQTAAHKGLLVTRLALSEAAINQRVQVSELDGDWYRVTQFGSAAQPRPTAAVATPGCCPGPA